MVSMARNRILAVALAALSLAACDEENPFRNTAPQVLSGENQVWELGLPAFPSGWDFVSGARIFVGTDEITGSTGVFVLDGRTDGTLVFRPFSTLLSQGLSVARTGIQDLGAVPWESVEEVPDGGYSEVNDASGVAVQSGHVYAFRITRQQGTIVPINFAKLQVIEVGTEVPGQPGSRFVRFRWAYQVQPLNHRVAVE
jgi:hypothetical protein